MHGLKLRLTQTITIRPDDTESSVVTNYVPLTPQSCVGDLEVESSDQIAQWTNAVFEAIARPYHLSSLLVTPHASPSFFTSSLPTPSPPSTPAPGIPVADDCDYAIAQRATLQVPYHKRRLSESESQPPPPPKRLCGLPLDASDPSSCRNVKLDCSVHDSECLGSSFPDYDGELDANKRLDFASADSDFINVPDTKHEAMETLLLHSMLDNWGGCLSETAYAANGAHFIHPVSKECYSHTETVRSSVLSDSNALNLYGTYLLISISSAPYFGLC
jgi:hypothetical protein